MSNKKKLIYISGPISGHNLKERAAEFQRVEYMLISLGFDVMNPMRNGLPSDASTHEHMKRDFEMLLHCDAAFFMERWLHSAGCKVEFDVATAIGLDIYFEECFRVKQFIKFR